VVKEFGMKKAFEGFGLAVIILFMAAAVFTFMAPRFGWSVDTVFSGSMEPKLKVGGVVVTRPVEAGDIKVGDIITFHSPLDEKLISHRVIAVEGGSLPSFQTKGDANEDADSLAVPAQNLVGKVCFHLPYLGYAVQFIKSPLGLVLTLCLPGLIVIVMEIVKLHRVLKEERAKREYGMW
jgi:signal peptidase